MLGDNRDLFMKGRRCQSLGIGAFVYYRRAVENQRVAILGEIIKIAKTIRAPAETIDLLQRSQAENQFSKSLEMVKDAVPESLRIQGHNPLTLLHDNLIRPIRCRMLGGGRRDHLDEITRWRDGLPEAKQRRLNHPGGVWHAWRRATAAEPRREPVKGAYGHAGGRPVLWSGEHIRRAACAIRETYSTDFFVIGRKALEADVRNEDDVDELLAGRRVQVRRGNSAAFDHVAAA